MKKVLYIVLDGLGDLPTPALNGATPLEIALTPNMDNLAKKGIAGMMYTVGKDIAPESDIAVISILGYDAHKYYTGRGPLESFAEGLEVNEGNLAYRVNFATLGEGDEIVDRRVGRSLTTEEASQLSDEINSRVKLTSPPAIFKFRNTIGHRGVLVIQTLKGKLSGRVTNTDPAYGKEGVFGVAKSKFEDILMKCKPEDEFENFKEAQDAANLTNEFIEKSRFVLDASEVNKRRLEDGKLPANIILTRDSGDRLPKFPPIRELFGLKFGCFVEMPVERGIALLTGMEIIQLPLPGGNLAEDYQHRAEVVIENITKFDGLYIHIKGPDEPAHDGDINGKIKSIEMIDKFFFANLIPKIDFKQTLITVTSDHSTPCILKSHSADPVPVLIKTSSLEPDGVEKFSEKECKKGSIGEIEGIQLMPLLVKFSQ